MQHVIKCSCWTGSQFSSIIPINVINVAVSADRAVLDNKIGISFDFSSSVLHHGSAGETWPRCPWLRWGFVSLHSTLIPACQGRTQGDGSKAAAASLQTPQRGVGEEDGLGGAGAEVWMCQAMKPLLIKADSKQTWEWEDSWEAQSGLELSSCEIAPTDRSWGWRRREIRTGRKPLWL